MQKVVNQHFYPYKALDIGGNQKKRYDYFNKAFQAIVYIFHISVVSGSCASFYMGNSNTILYRQQKPLQVLYITVSNLKNDNCTGKGQFEENNNTMPLQMFYYNVRKGKFLQRRKNNNYNTDKLPKGHYKTKSKKKMKIKAAYQMLKIPRVGGWENREKEKIYFCEH